MHRLGIQAAETWLAAGPASTTSRPTAEHPLTRSSPPEAQTPTRLVLRQDASRHGHLVDLVRTVIDPRQPRLPVEHRQRVILGHAGRPKTWIARSTTSCRTRAPKNLIKAISSRARSHRPCLSSTPRATSSGAQHGCQRATPRSSPGCSPCGERRAERLALACVAAHQLEGALRDAEPAHAVMDAPGPEPLLCQDEARALVTRRFDTGTRSPRSGSRHGGCRPRP